MTVSSRSRSQHAASSVGPVGHSRSGRTGPGYDRGGGLAASRRVVRCAVYTRKSSEEGLEQAFNSLDAQREACEAYVRSQQHEGWMVLPALYDDGGFSGGTMERPALKRLLADIRVGNVDVVVVYKIDRLTRSLFDFAKIVETFDAAQASFVSITQSFNTTTSMGRLTLNVLLSFAQFEREVTGERIRDKIAASKRKGMWMGGNVPLGYDLANRKLVINEPEAQTVRTIFQLYLDHGTVRVVKTELDRLGLRTKARGGGDDTDTSIDTDTDTGTDTGSPRRLGRQPFGIGHLHTVLRNPLYVGMVRHKGELHAGEHEAIVAAEHWDAVQAKLHGNATERLQGRSEKAPSLLTGRIFDADGHRLTPSHAVKGSKRYRYYVTGGRDLALDATLRIPAADIEAIVVGAVRDLLLDQNRIVDVLGRVRSPVELRAVIEQGRQLAARLVHPNDPESAALLRAILDRVSVSTTTVRISIARHQLFARLQDAASGDADGPTRIEIAARSLEGDDDGLEPIVIEQAIALRRRGREQRLILTAASAPSHADPEAALIKAILRARIWFAALKERRADSIADLGRREDVARAIISHHLPLAFLAPDITEAVIQGRQPIDLTIERMIAIAGASPVWDQQRAMFRAS